MNGTERLLGAWDDLPLDDLLELARETVENPELPTVAAWRAAGGRVVGHFQVYCPEEIIHAAGLLPVKVRGAQVESRQADARFGSYLCSILKTSLELAMSGRLQLDLFVTHPICDAARNLAAVWGRNFPYPARILYLPQNPNSIGSASYLTAEYGRLREDVEEISGTAVTEAALRGSIAVFNENRRLLRQLYEIRRETPARLRVDECYALVALGGLITREEHNAVLGRAIPMIAARGTQPRDLLRVVFEGGFCEQPPLELLRTIAASCYVVDDDLLIGLRWLVEDVRPNGSGDALHALARAYLDASSYSPVQHDLRKPKERMLLERIRRAGAQAAIVAAAKMCEPGLEEQVAYSRSLDEHGISHFVTEFEERMSTYEHLQIQLETFVENVLFA
ncbi:MAG TPA: 2-hydroxyacyl-CoA dehydratase [Vicinamibacterales bacterium]|nr:2-hydroxyacyl-CoA dehydratase [Vicinamibacterales bacterium]